MPPSLAAPATAASPLLCCDSVFLVVYLSPLDDCCFEFLFLPCPLMLAFNFATHRQQLFLTCHLRRNRLSHCIAAILLVLLVALDCLHLTEKTSVPGPSLSQQQLLPAPVPWQGNDVASELYVLLAVWLCVATAFRDAAALKLLLLLP